MASANQDIKYWENKEIQDQNCLYQMEAISEQRDNTKILIKLIELTTAEFHGSRYSNQ